MSHHQLSQALVDSFTALADEVQSLTDSKTVLEHKLRFAHEQFQYLADKYAPAAPEIAETLTKLQLPPHTSVDPLASVPLPQKEIGASQHQIALVIRDGRRAASRLASLGDASKTTASSRDTLSRTSDQEDSSSMSTALEQDFTVQGKRGNLQCPFSKKASAERTGESAVDGSHNAITASEDFPCATLEADTTANDGFGKCPIRYMDKHSPEEIARYVELHKHELPRSHEVCLRRYQGNEDQIRKLDSKYGNMTSMIEDLSQLHKPMLPERDDRHESVDGASNQRVEDWAQGISVSSDAADPDELAPDGTDDDRQSHFDRPLKEVRVGESPSRPWGISVPIYDADTHGDEKLFSPPPAPPVRMPSPPRPMPAHGKAAGKCPFDHTKFAGGAGGPPPMPRPMASNQPPAGLREAPTLTPKNGHGHEATAATQPVFIGADAAQLATGGRHMVFQGPVFIGYPMEDAMRFMNQFQGN